MTWLKFLVLTGALGIVLPGWAQTNLVLSPAPAVVPPAASGPRIEFAAPNFDFGKVDAGKLVAHDFVFTNTGDQWLEISDVHPGCGCTTAGAWDRRVAPGKTGTIPVQFNSDGYGGIIQKTVTVSCNDPARKSVVLQLNGAIERPFDLTPRYAMFNLMPEGQANQTHTVRIISNYDQPMTVSGPICSNPAFQTELRTVREGKEFELQVTVIPSRISSNLTALITLKTSSVKRPVLSLTAYALVQPLVVVNPPKIALPAGPLPQATPITVTIQNNSIHPLVLSDPAINAPGADVQLKEIQPGRRFNLAINFPKGFQSQPDESIAAVVKSNLPKLPIIKIPVIWPGPPPAIHSATSQVDD